LGIRQMEEFLFEVARLHAIRIFKRY